MSLTEPQREDDCTPKLQEESTSCIAIDEQETASSSEKGLVAKPKEDLASVTTSNKKTPKCHFFKKTGKCRYGDGCRFAHELPEESPRNDSGLEVAAGDDEAEEQCENSSQGKTSSVETEKTVCRFYSRSGWCRNGKRCRFIHDRKKADVSAKKDASKQDESQDVTAEDTSREVPSNVKSVDAKKKKERQRKICRYFKVGHCSMGDQCKFLHPEESQEVNTSVQTKRGRSEKTRAAVARPNIIKNESMSMKIADMSEDDLKKYRETEITQLMKRFTKDYLTVMEKEGEETFYRVIINPTDPDWPFDIRDFELEVMFPANYPLEPFTITMPEDQVLPNTVLQHMSENINEWIQARHGINQISGKVELMFRPFLRWLDRGLEKMFTDAAKKFKKVVDANVAGFEFVAFSQQKPKDIQKSHDSMIGPEGVTIAKGKSTASEPDVTDKKPSADTVSGFTPTTEKNRKDDLSNVQRKGTEIKFNGLQLSESISTVVAQKIGIIIQCSRCKNKCDIITPPRRLNSARCGKCQHQQLITFRPSLVHHFTATLGFLDLEGCTTFDLILPECDFLIGCLNCSEEVKVLGLQFGQMKAQWCEKCHVKMTLQIEMAKFQRLQASDSLDADKAHIIQMKMMRKQVHPDIHEGHSLPHNGTCKHYKKSFRWLRFPCCGKCYPCDECHNEEETDHEMKYANRMICGFCCKEQQYTPDKPCISCQSLTTKSRTSHWEGGLGCRNKTKMSKADKQKYSSTNKTVSRKQQNIQADKK